MSRKNRNENQFEESVVLSRMADNLRQIFEAKGIEPRPFAIATFGDYLPVYRILAQKTTPKIHVVARLAHALGVSIDELTDSKKK